MSTTETLSAELRAMLTAAVEAPSVLNTQPWRFRVLDDGIEVHADPALHLAATDPRGRQQAISCGAALYNLSAAARHFGHEPVVTVLPDPGRPTLLAAVRLDRPYTPAEADHALFAVIGVRHSARHPYSGARLDAEVVAHLEDEAEAEGGLLRVLPEPEVAPFLRLAAEADARLRENPRVREEFAAWVGARGDEGDDGVPDAALGTLDTGEHPVIRDLAMGEAVPGRPTGTGEAVPNLALVSTYGDETADWLRAGAATERVLLYVTTLGMVSSFLTQPLEDDDIRAWVRHPGRPDTYPQVAVRLGYGQRGTTSPRRPLDAFLL